MNKLNTSILNVRGKDYYFIVNPAAGGGRKMEVIAEIEAFFQERKLDFENSLASFPFTHNRPEEDVCVVALKK